MFLRTSDIPREAYRLLKFHISARRKHLQRYKYLLFDEFQDIDPYLYEILKMFSEIQGKLFVVGDPNQSIYEFRGSMPIPFINLQRSLNPKVLKMSLNYRSSPEVIEFANNLISHNNQGDFQNNLTSMQGPEGPVEFIHKEKSSELDDFIVSKLREIQEKALDETVAVLFRSN
ncbi:hypothetical protein PVNG_02340 [Plasmodium vivax North Korean]|uniref:DNA 3'-5' helicase n=1 Tax=Plasmodium vivax North Korean TaxID=1035514 RepID=A0A0J9TN66_PLAVI|nr:hypothetical protein PVNG_02340 [Plasmodium vivax North Korean]